MARRQVMSVSNGDFGCACYHALFVFNQFGDLERCALRPGFSLSFDDSVEEIWEISLTSSTAANSSA
jgi:hypothetical protein